MDRPLFIVGPPPPRQPRGSAEWGIPMPLLHASIADIREQDLVIRVLNDLHHRHALFNIKGLRITEADVHKEVQLRLFRAELKGDIDILVIPRGAPEEATAIHVKKFKVGRKAVRTGRPNRLDKFREGVWQANDLARLGFAQVYLWVFVVVDTREQNAGRFAYDGPDSLLRSRIQQAISVVGLEPRVGLMEFDWVQPMDRAPFEFGTHGGHLRRLAKPVPQDPPLTAWLCTPRAMRRPAPELTCCTVALHVFVGTCSLRKKASPPQTSWSVSLPSWTVQLSPCRGRQVLARPTSGLG